MLSKEQILAAKDCKTETVDIPMWEGSVVVRGLSARDRDEYEESLIKGKKRNMSNARAKLFVKCVIDDSGDLMFNDRDVTPLGAKSAAALDLVFGVALRLSGMNATDVEELEKNSEAALEDSSNTD